MSELKIGDRVVVTGPVAGVEDIPEYAALDNELGTITAEPESSMPEVRLDKPRRPGGVLHWWIEREHVTKVEEAPNE